MIAILLVGPSPALAQPPLGIIADARAYCDAALVGRQDAAYATSDAMKRAMGDCVFAQCRRLKGDCDACIRARDGR